MRTSRGDYDPHVLPGRDCITVLIGGGFLLLTFRVSTNSSDRKASVSIIAYKATCIDAAKSYKFCTRSSLSSMRMRPRLDKESLLRYSMCRYAYSRHSDSNPANITLCVCTCIKRSRRCDFLRLRYLVADVLLVGSVRECNDCIRLVASATGTHLEPCTSDSCSIFPH